MPLEVHVLVFPRFRFTTPQAAAWASLHGFDHGVVDVVGDGIRVEHRPRGVFDPATLHPILVDPEEGIRAVVGGVFRHAPRASSRLSYLLTDEDVARYERFSAALRARALIGDTRVGLDANSRENLDLARWYRAWFVRTHPGPSEEDLWTADAIATGIMQASREHALDYVGKLGYAKGGSRRRELRG